MGARIVPIAPSQDPAALRQVQQLLWILGPAGVISSTHCIEVVQSRNHLRRMRVDRVTPDSGSWLNWARTFGSGSRPARQGPRDGARVWCL